MTNASVLLGNETKSVEVHIAEPVRGSMNLGLGVLMFVGLAAASIGTLVAFHNVMNRLLGR